VRAVFRHCDVALVVGSRFIDGMAPIAAWPAKGIRYIFLNISNADMTAPREVAIPVQGDALLGMQKLAVLLRGCNQPHRSHLIQRVRSWAQMQIDAIEPQAGWVRALASGTAPDDLVVHEMTQIGYVARLSFPVHRPAGYLTPGYQGTLGFGFPTALGASFARPNGRVVSLNGDGGFGWNLQELSTAVKYALNITIIVFVDGYFGNVRTIQTNLFGQNIGVDLHNPDYQLLARAMGVSYTRADSPDMLVSALRAGRLATGPLLVEVHLGQMPSPWHLFKLQAPATGSGSTHAEPPDPLVVV
jgi:acetolactate synthase I/II/III large subunit